MPFIMDFRADWCAPCRKFEAEVLRDPAVKEALQRTPLYTVDLTERGDGPEMKMAKQFGIAGVPTLLFIDSLGAEKERITEFVNKGSFLEKLRTLAGEEAP
jgi:thiol:disulfide interchange protein DsbD